MRDFTGAGTAPFRVEFDVRTVYDFVLSLSDDAGSTDDLPAADRAWLEASKSSLPDSIRTDLAQLFGTEHCVVISTFVVDRPEIKTAAQLVDALKAASTVEIARTLLGQHLPTPELKAAGDQALAGDQAQIDTVLAAIHEQKRSTAERVLSDPAAIAGAVVGVLEAWLDRFVPIEDRVAAMLRRDVADRATDIANLNPIDLIERTTGGIRLLPEPWVRRVILAPSYFARPYNFVFAVGDWRQFSYPIADTALDAADPLAPPQAIVRLHRALGDETRLRILRLLRDRDWYLTEIAQQLELSKPTIKHHLAQLRAAGLVTLTEEGGLSYYSLRRQRLDDASVDLKRFLVDA